MPSKTEFKRGFKTKAEKLAVEYREQLGLTMFKPLCAYKLAKHLDVPIFSVDDAFHGDESHPAYRLMCETQRFDALWMHNEDGDKIILHNHNHCDHRLQSTLMHELSHIILGHSIDERTARLAMQFNLHCYNKEQEDEAKYLGGCLQIPKPSALMALKGNWSEERSISYFNASSEMVRYRLNMFKGIRRN